MLKIKIVTDGERKNVAECPHCKQEITSRHQHMGYCPRCFKSLDKKDRSIRFGCI